LYPPLLAESAVFTGITGPRLWQVMQALAGFGLIDVTDRTDRPETRVTRIHPLVRYTSSLGSDPAERRALLALAAGLLRRAAESDYGRQLIVIQAPRDSATWPVWHALAPHVLHVFEAVIAVPGYPSDAVTAAAYAAGGVAVYQAARGLV